MEEFANLLSISECDKILDLGGTYRNWLLLGMNDVDVTMADVLPYRIPEDVKLIMPNLKQIVQDATDLKLQDSSYDVIFSNSVIEHVGTWENQKKFAQEVLRVGGPDAGIWIQTPAKCFFIEPHFMAIGLHWLPKSWQRHLMPWLSGWGWINRFSPAEGLEKMLAEIRLLTKREMHELFPGCDIRRERFLGIFTKSYVAWRPGASR